MVRRISIRASLLRNLVALILLLAGALFAATYWGVRGTVRTLSQRVIEQTADHAATTLNSFFDPVRDNLGLIQEWGSEGLLADLSGSDSLNRFFQPVRGSLPQVSSINTGNARGAGWLMLADGTGWRNRIVTEESVGQSVRWERWESPGRRVEVREEALAYDPRQRPWYVGAQGREAGEIHWTAPYTFFTTKDPGITASVRIRPPESEPFVVAFDLTLDDISRFTRSLHVSENGVALIYHEGSGGVIGLPRHPRFEARANRLEVLLEPVEALGLPVLTDGMDAANRIAMEEGHREVLFRFESGGEGYWAGVRLFELGPQDRLRIAVVVPESDVLAGLAQQRVRILAGAGIALAIGIGLALRLSRKYSRPLGQLVEQSNRIGRLDLERGAGVATDLREIDHLAREQERTRSALLSFSRYVPIDLVRQLMHRGEAAAIGGRTEELSLLFTDIREFTSVAEGMDPADLTQHMAEYFESMVAVLGEEGATIDKFVGDAIVAFWGAPEPNPEHAFGAVRAVLRCSEVLDQLNRKWAAAGKPVLPTCFGVSTGSAVVGNVGARTRLAYTALGDTVNVAARLENLTRRYGVEALVTGAVRNATADTFVWREVDRVSVKGREEALDLFEPLGRTGDVDPERLQWARDYEGALELYRAREFKAARQAFEGLEARRPGDVSARLFADACVRFEQDPPPDDWDGVARLSTKV